MKKSVVCILAVFASVTAMTAQTLTLTPDNIDLVIRELTLDEKIDLIVGTGGNVVTDATATVGSQSDAVPGAAGQSNGVPRLGIPPMILADGPAGLRISPTRQDDDRTFYCTHFPVEMALSASWNPALVEKVGEAMGDEVKHYGVDILLAPATNIHRNPLNGRNFEYYSEDPLLAGRLCAAMIRGVQKNDVGTSLKHFAFNNQETNRAAMDVIGSPRTFREIYLKPFEIAVRESRPWTVMTAYNMVNGTMTSERSDLVTDILRDEWGFDGMVMSDWYGGRSAFNQMMAGNDMLQPGREQQRDEIKRAVLNGRLSRKLIDRNVRHILECVVRTPRFNGYKADNNPDLKAHALVTRNAANEGMVLLKNDKNTLPLGPKVANVAVFGCTSYDFIAGGTGSGDVNHAYVVSLIDGLKNAGLDIDPTLGDLYARYIPVATEKLPKKDGPLASFLPKDRIPEMELDSVDFKDVTGRNDIAIVTIGKTSGEFIDRRLDSNYGLTPSELRTLTTVCNEFHRAGKKVVVILNTCGVIETANWISMPDAVLVSWLPGQEGGNSVADILTGKENPSGRLPMTWPLDYADLPSAKDFPVVDTLVTEKTDGTVRNVDFTEYTEGIYVGYRHFTTNNIPVAFPFGYGLSYTTFKYDNFDVTKSANGDITVNVRVSNTGRRAGKDVVQVYVSAPGKDMDKPVRELKGFAKTDRLEAGQSQTLTITIPYADLASFNEVDNVWQVEAGDYDVAVAHHAADTKPLIATVSQSAAVTQKVTPALNRYIPD